MPNRGLGTGPLTSFGQARVAALDERVTNIGTRVTNLEQEVRSGFSQVHDHISRNSATLNAELAQFGVELRSGQKTQWPVIIGFGILFTSILLGFGGTIGWLSLQPLRDMGTENRADIKALVGAMTTLTVGMPEKFVTKAETEPLRARAAEDRSRTELAIRDLNETIEGRLVTRAEWMERNRGRDTEIADLQRQITSLSEAQGSQYNSRDIILRQIERGDELQNIIMQLQSRMAELQARLPGGGLLP